MRLLICLTMAAVFAALLQASGQQLPDRKKEIHIGIKGGLTSSRFSNDIGPFTNAANKFYADKRISGEAGLLVTCRLSPVTSLRGELMYSMKGMSYRREVPAIITYTSAGESKTYFYNTFILNYLEMPLMGSFNLTRAFIDKKAKGGIMLNAGLAPAWCHESSFRDGGKGMEWAENASGERSSIAEGPFNQEKKVLFSALSEISFHSPLAGRSAVFIYVRYQRSLGSVYRNALYQSENLKTPLSTVSLGTGFVF